LSSNLVLKLDLKHLKAIQWYKIDQLSLFVSVEESSVDKSSEEGFVEEIEPSISYTRSHEERVRDLETRLARVVRYTVI
jgi:hypothetical protein